MAKFYVESGDIKRIEVAKDAFSAMVLAVQKISKKSDDISLSSFFIANERGFGFTPCKFCKISEDCEIEDLNKCPHLAEHDQCIASTRKVLESAGLLGDFSETDNQT